MLLNNKKNKGFLDDVVNTKRFVSHESALEEYENNKYSSNKRNKYSYNKLNTAAQLRVASQYKQAVIKITSYGRMTDKISAHLSYISRNHQLDLEDQNGSLIQTKIDSNILLEKWQSIYFDNRVNSRNTVHITFSSPEGSNRNNFNQAIRECLQEEFGGRNDYLFVQHDDTDHPHAHAVIVMRSLHGKKLDPRKQYLHHLRDFFAKKCREHGIKVEASRRFERGLNGSSRKSAMVQMYKQRGVIPQKDLDLKEIVKTSSITTRTEPKQRNIHIRNHYQETATKLLLDASNDTNKQDKSRKQYAAKLLSDFAIIMPYEPTLPEQLKKVIDANRAKQVKKHDIKVTVDNQKHQDKEIEI